MQKQATLKVQGMTCMHCENFVKTLLEDTTSVEQVQVSATKEEASFTYDDQQVSLENISESINKTEVYKVIP